MHPCTHAIDMYGYAKCWLVPQWYRNHSSHQGVAVAVAALCCAACLQLMMPVPRILTTSMLVSIHATHPHPESTPSTDPPLVCSFFFSSLLLATACLPAPWSLSLHSFIRSLGHTSFLPSSLPCFALHSTPQHCSAQLVSSTCTFIHSLAHSLTLVHSSIPSFFPHILSFVHSVIHPSPPNPLSPAGPDIPFFNRLLFLSPLLPLSQRAGDPTLLLPSDSASSPRYLSIVLQQLQTLHLPTAAQATTIIIPRRPSNPRYTSRLRPHSTPSFVVFDHHHRQDTRPSFQPIPTLHGAHFRSPHLPHCPILAIDLLLKRL
ncbi:unnamed protein product [Periconia digitata]|uniref:Uncharacterized protein n=1 Tax=Periconia digitata TaxID=1303443 RepID=A0A9W4URM1_9PLEO|nr:unnamed protein product [Periconia digitata]